LGVERLIIALEKAGNKVQEQIRSKIVYLANLDASCDFVSSCVKLAMKLRERGIRVEMNYAQTSLGTHIKKANQLGVRHLLILGPDEISKKIVTIKDLDERKQTEVNLAEITTYLAGVMGL